MIWFEIVFGILEGVFDAIDLNNWRKDRKAKKEAKRNG